MLTLSVVKLLTLDTIVAVKNWVHDRGCIEHCLEALNMRIDFFVVFRQVRHELVNEHP
jgi:hypothetical protein